MGHLGGVFGGGGGGSRSGETESAPQTGGMAVAAPAPAPQSMAPTPTPGFQSNPAMDPMANAWSQSGMFGALDGPLARGAQTAIARDPNNQWGAPKTPAQLISPYVDRFTSWVSGLNPGFDPAGAESQPASNPTGLSAGRALDRGVESESDTDRDKDAGYGYL